MLHYVHRLVANFVCLSLGAGLVAVVVFRAFSLPAVAESYANESGESEAAQ